MRGVVTTTRPFSFAFFFSKKESLCRIDSLFETWSDGRLRNVAGCSDDINAMIGPTAWTPHTGSVVSKIFSCFFVDDGVVANFVVRHFVLSIEV